MDFGLFDIDNWKSLKDHYLKIVSQTEAYPVQLPDFSSENECKAFIINQLVLHKYKQDFERDGNPLNAMGAFQFSYQNGFDAPCWVTKWLYDGFSQFENRSGDIDLSILLGFKSKQKTGSCFKVKAERERNFMICFEVHLLKLATGLSIEKCSEVTSMIYENNCIWGNLTLIIPSPSAIATLYSNQRKAFRVEEMLNDEFESDSEKLKYVLKHLDAFKKAIEKKDYSFCDKDLQDILKRLSPR